jgi:hypothetical protein
MKKVLTAIILSFIIFKGYFLIYDLFVDMEPGDTTPGAPPAIAVFILWLFMFGSHTKSSDKNHDSDIGWGHSDTDSDCSFSDSGRDGGD